MDKDIIEVHMIDPNLDSYRQFFDLKWAERMFNEVETSPLKDAICTLMVAWRSANGSHMLPWLMAQSLKGFAENECKGSLRFRSNYSSEVVKGLVGKIDIGMRYSLNRDQHATLMHVVSKIEMEVNDALKAAHANAEFPLDDYWGFLTHSSEFQFAILGSQRTSYNSLFFAYEDLLSNVIRTKQPTYSSKNESISVGFARHFGKPLADFCWNHDEVILAKLVRNALAHNGGRFGKDFEKYNTRFTDESGTKPPVLRNDHFIIVNGMIQIVPGNTMYLFGILKARVTEIVEKLFNLPQNGGHPDMAANSAIYSSTM